MNEPTPDPLRLQRDDGGEEQPAYLSAIWCPSCSGEGTYEVMRQTGDLTAMEPTFDVIPCETCGGDQDENTPGTGTRPVVRCAHCNLPVHPDILEVQGDHPDAEFIDDEEEYDILRGLDQRERARIEWCECGGREHAEARAAISLTTFRMLTLVRMRGHDDGCGEPLTGLHGVDPGTLLALGHGNTQYWRNYPHADTSYLTAEVRVADHRGVAMNVTLYSRRPLERRVIEHIYATHVKINHPKRSE